MKTPLPYLLRRYLLTVLFSVGAILSLPALAGQVELANIPLANSTTSTVQPNLMLMLDDSGSMDWDYMPDNAKNFSNKYGYNSSQCNGAYYNPTITYDPPVDAANVSLGDSTFTAAWKNGFDHTEGTTNLSSAFTGGSGTGSSGINLTPQAAFYYNYTGSLTAEADKNYFSTSNTFYQQCNSSIGSSPGSGVFTKINFTTATATEKTNFANWYSYYSTRMLMMKTGVGRAFKTLNSSFRVGFMTLNNNNSPDFVNIAPFTNNAANTAGQKFDWYAKLYAAAPGNKTPLREALSKVGNLYANKFSPQTVYTSTIRVSGSGSTSVSSITVGGGPNIMSATSTADTSTSKVATNVASEINSVDPSNYSAVRSSSDIIITGTVADLGITPVVTKTGSMTLTPGAFVATTTTPQLNGMVPNDPIEYACQKNFVILSTDGYWNGTAGYKLNGSAIGNQDHSAARPMYDGAPLQQLQTQVTKTETQVARTTSQQTQRTEQLQTRTKDLQATRTQQQSQTSTLQVKTTQRTSQTSTLQGTLSKVLMQCSGTSAFCGSAPATGVANAQWTVVTGSSGTCATSTTNQCAIVSGLSGSVTVAAACNTSATINTSAGAGTVTLTITGSSNAVIDRIRAAGTSTTDIGSAATTASSANNTVASRIAARINACTSSATGSCDISGHSATVSGNVVTVSGPNITSGFSVRVNSGSASIAIVHTPGSSIYTLSNADSNGKVYSACSYNDGTPVSTASCTNVAKSTASPYTVLTSTQCTDALVSDFADATSACTAGTSGTGLTTTCQYTPWSAGVGTDSCTPASQNNVNLTATQCPIVTTTDVVTSCEVTNTRDINGYMTTLCQYTPFTAWAGIDTCSAQAQSSGPSYVGPARECQNIDTTVGVNTCSAASPTSGNNYATISCATVTTGGSTYYVDSCTAASASAGNNWTTTTCTPSTVSGPALAASCTPGLNTTTHITTTCNVTTVGPTSVSSCTPSPATSGNAYTTTTCVGDATGGTLDTLADTAMYYYQNDLRDTSLSNCTGVLGTDVCDNNVFTSGIDTNKAQHLTTFTLGLGARGRMVYSSSYLKDTTGDFFAVKSGSTASSTVCNWQTSGTVCNWPVPSDGAIENIDDLWHAAVDGRGKYFSASDPAKLSVGLTEALKSINQVTGAASAAATSTLNPTAENNSAYVASYTTVKWSGNLERRSITVDPTSTDPLGTVSTTATWCVENIASDTCAAPNLVTPGSSAGVFYCSPPVVDINAPTGIDAGDCAAPEDFIDGVVPTCKGPQIANTCPGTLPVLIELDKATPGTRHIFTPQSGALVEFNTAHFGSDTNFATAHISGLSQWGSLTSTQQTAAAGNNLVNYLRGQYDFEENRTNNPTANWLYRYRDAVMGDALESQPTYAKAPPFNYADPGYTTFKSDHASRTATVFMGTNDGMMHAFNADTGVERWAFIPSIVMPNLWRLADINYDTHHTNYVNGSPVVSDICVSSCGTESAVWKTIMVAGLNGGGRGYYALDVTDESNPLLLWEYSSDQNADLGYSFNVPIVTKKQDGTWVVIVTSGYDNGSYAADGTAYATAGDGEGHLFVLNAADGTLISDISTGEGTAASPSGLAKISGYATETASNRVGYIYGGDLSGNLWRFDINSTDAAATGTGSAFQFVTLKDSSGTAQPITAAPTLGKIFGKRVIFIGTGKYLETTDLSTTQTQTVYAIKDDDLQTPRGNPRTGTGALVEQTMVSDLGTGLRSPNSGNTVNFNTGLGWFVDLPDSGERVYMEAKLIQGILVMPSIVPSNTVCSSGGYSWQNYFDYKTGSIDSVEVDGIIVGINDIYIDNQAIILTVTNADPTPRKVPHQPTFPQNDGRFQNQRQIWREWIPE